MQQPTNLLLTMLLALLLACTPIAARAQSCTTDAEPNEQPPQATPAAIGCVEGTLQGGDQDFFTFQFGPTEAAQRWMKASIDEGSCSDMREIGSDFLGLVSV